MWLQPTPVIGTTRVPLGHLRPAQACFPAATRTKPNRCLTCALRKINTPQFSPRTPRRFYTTNWPIILCVRFRHRTHAQDKQVSAPCATGRRADFSRRCPCSSRAGTPSSFRRSDGPAIPERCGYHIRLPANVSQNCAGGCAWCALANAGGPHRRREFAAHRSLVGGVSAERSRSG